MNMWKRILLCALIVVLGMAFVPLWGRAPVFQCLHLWRYAISYAPPGGHAVLPEGAFPGFPPHCMDVPRLQGYSF